MPVKLRLQRHGKKGAPFYHIVAADARAPRDGKFIERVGSYNPNTNPATIDLDLDKSIKWLRDGAQPTETVKAILSYKGVLYRNHLLKGVAKGALTQEQADAKFATWLQSKQEKIDGKRNKLASAKTNAYQERLAAEIEYNKKKAEAIAAKNTPVVEEAPAVEEAPEVTEAAADTTEETAAE
ncbi:MAG TPA: 30S ribosomal protein S16 [Luteibaculaceae bacterium]|nr:30S ribosomal protein S16 [Luteibaculaceae bacterium]